MSKFNIISFIFNHSSSTYYGDNDNNNNNKKQNKSKLAHGIGNRNNLSSRDSGLPRYDYVPQVLDFVL